VRAVAQGLRAFGSRWLGARITRRYGHSLRNLLTAASTLGVTDPAPADLVQLVYRRELPKVPWLVLTAGLRTWPEHQSLAAFVPWGRNVLVPGSRHMIHMDRPDAAVMAVREVLRGLSEAQ